jgi:hypothetical protein
MKATVAVFTLLGGVALAQDFVAPAGRQREIVPEAAAPTPTIEGMVKEIFVTKKPWQAINPLAPAKFGSGEKLVSKDFGPATPFHAPALTVIGVEW